MKFAKAWTWRTPMKTVQFPKGMDCPAEALADAEKAGVLAEAEPAPKPSRRRK